MRNLPESTRASAEEKVAQLFGLYKAEWLNGQLFDLFTEPEYFKELKTPRPCVLIGGRGTGKTTVLRGMSYEGQFALNGGSVSDWRYFGLYQRINTNRVMAFRGPELTQEQWIRCFAHYVNLVLCGSLLDFVVWYSSVTSTKIEISAKTLHRVQLSLRLPSCSSLSELSDYLEEARIIFESSINNVADEPPRNLSLQGAPIDELADALVSTSEFSGKQFFFLLDEYENFQDYQQQVVNTIIKHARSSYTFKIGVRELGWRVRATLNQAEHLRHPADYARINIREEFTPERFVKFAEAVCNGRLARGTERLSGQPPITVSEILVGLTVEEEARELGVAEPNEKTLQELAQRASGNELEFARRMTPANLYLVRYWAEASGKDLREVLVDSMQDPAAWGDRFNNYMHAALFTIHRNKRGIRKYYAGWRVLTRIADGNIRYLLELVHQSLLYHIEAGSDLSEPISAKHQTQAAQQVGKKNLSELEGIAVEGGRLTKLLLSLGRIFQVLAETPSGHTPEANQFYLANENEKGQEGVGVESVDELLKSAVMHLALVRSTGNKLLDEADTREYDYMMHTVFAPFFGFSHRRKRKIRLSTRQLLGLVESPRATIREVLVENKRSDEELSDLDGGGLPDQLLLFEGYYRGGL